MEYFEYLAKIPATGQVMRGIVTADDMESGKQSLKGRGITIIEMSPMRDFLNIRKTLYSYFNKIKKKTLQEFFEQLSFMLDTDIQLYTALTTLRDFGANKKIMALTKPLAENVRKGLSLHEAMEKTKHFTIPIIQQVKSGEESGNVPNTLNRISADLTRDLEFKKKVKGALTYPIIIMIVMSAVLWVLMVLVVPQISKTIIGLGGELPLITKIVIGASGFMVQSTPYFILFIIASVAAFKYLYKNEQFRYAIDKAKLKIPFAGNLILKMELGRFCRNLAAMQESGITLVRSLKVTQSAIKNAYLKKLIDKATNLVEVSGLNLSLALSKSGHFPELMIQLIDVGVSTGKIAEVLSRIAERYEKDVDNSIKKATSMIEPLMIIVVGALAGTVVIAMFLPLLSVVDSLQ